MIRRFLYWLTNHLPAREIKGDDGEPYLERYYIGRLFGVQAYIHRFVAPDPGRDLHDHPWAWAWSFILSGGYIERRQAGVGAPECVTYHEAPGFNKLRGTDFHRIQHIYNTTNYDDCWTLFIHGHNVKKWGFLQPVHDHTWNAPVQIWRQHVYQGGNDSAGTWWENCPKGRELRAEK